MAMSRCQGPNKVEDHVVDGLVSLFVTVFLVVGHEGLGEILRDGVDLQASCSQI